jgi:hypothetical protein
VIAGDVEAGSGEGPDHPLPHVLAVVLAIGEAEAIGDRQQ